MRKLIKDRDDRPLTIHSSLAGPLSEASFLQRSLIFAELSMIAYFSPPEAAHAAAQVGFSETQFFDRNGAQAYRFCNQHDCVVTCRGTELNDWNDIDANVRVGTVLAEIAGRVHRGFKREVDDLWPELETVLMDNDLPLWLCGHSLGGAMATICAGRCFLSHIPSNPEALVTFGSPRVGDRAYVNYVNIDHYRWVHNNDIVTCLPPTWMGYRHNGREIYLDSLSRIRKLSGVARRMDGWRGFFMSLRAGKLDYLSDHTIQGYLEAIASEFAADQREIRQGESATQGIEISLPAPKAPGAYPHSTSKAG